ncbi:MAG TPA: hypothetical protein PLQ97_15055 [Myxococcota bacterium]|nr:hypothetical protein [Myxococcota bacterium]HQK52541.1 hypothetical protein [Myxococcota bacterium]
MGEVPIRLRWVAVVALWIAWGCVSGSGGGEDLEVQADGWEAEVSLPDLGPVDLPPELEPDWGPEGADGPPEDAEAREDGPSRDLVAIEVPWWPPPPARPAVDEPYVQEFNHTSNEADPDLAPLVSVVLRPGGFSGPEALPVTPRGLAWERREAGWTLLGPAAGEEDLVAAAGGFGVVALASPAVLYRVAPDGSVVRDEAPDGLTILGLDTLDGGAWMRTSVGAAPVPPTGPVQWPSGGSPVTALGWSLEGLLLAGHPDGTLTFHDLPAEGLPGPEVATLAPDSGLAGGAVRGVVVDARLPVPLDLVVISDGGIRGIRLLSGGGRVAEVVEVPWFAPDRVPLDGPRAVAATWDGGFVVATGGGAYRIMDRGSGPEWRVYGSERWVPSEDVRGVATDPDQDLAPIFLATSRGLGFVASQRLTLEEKLAPFVDRVVQRHDRDGAVADSRLMRKGDLSTSIPWDSDNDGSWTAYWLMGECARWRVTGDPEARAHFDRSLDAMLFLRDVTGTDWFVARSVIRKEGCRLDDCDHPDDGDWYTSADGKWWVKRDTSNDELIAHFSMMAMAWEFCADEDQRRRIADHLRGIVGGLIDHGYRLIDPITGEVTTYGQLDPEYVNEWIAGVYGDGGLRAAILLAGLQVAWLATGEDRFLQARWGLIEDHGYADAAEREILHEVRPYSMDNDEMSSWAWWTLLRYETDPWLRDRWRVGFSGVYDVKLRQQQAALWALVRATTGFDDADLVRDLRDWLRRVPVDLIRWDMHNSHRRDVVPIERPFDPVGGGLRSDGRPVPYDERRCDRFNTDQYRLDGGMGGMVEMDGAEVLLCYWMARLFGLLVPE